MSIQKYHVSKNLFDIMTPEESRWTASKTDYGVYYVSNFTSSTAANRYRLLTEQGKTYTISGSIDNNAITVQLSNYLSGTEYAVGGDIRLQGTFSSTFTAQGEITLSIFAREANQSATITDLIIYEGTSVIPYEEFETNNLLAVNNRVLNASNWSNTNYYYIRYSLRSLLNLPNGEITMSVFLSGNIVTGKPFGFTKTYDGTLPQEERNVDYTGDVIKKDVTLQLDSNDDVYLAIGDINGITTTVAQQAAIDLIFGNYSLMITIGENGQSVFMPYGTIWKEIFLKYYENNEWVEHNDQKYHNGSWG